MSDTPGNPIASPWWILLLVLAALPIGWWVGGLPVPGTRAPKPAQSQVAPATAAPDARSAQAPPPASQPVRIIRPSEPAIVSQWTDLGSAIAQSERNGKPVLIDFNAEWCGPCKRMKRDLFDDWTHGQAVRTAVIPVSIVDRQREEGRNPPEFAELYQRFQVDAFPTLVVFSPASGKTVRTQGFGGAEATLAWITQAAQAVR